jgi:hypothetical protein
MKPAINDTRRQLGELGAMSAQVEQAERQILERAEKRLQEVEVELQKLRTAALAHDDDAPTRYQELVLERGKLHQVIAQARQHLN